MEGWIVEVNGKCLPEPYVLSAVYVNKMKGGRFDTPLGGPASAIDGKCCADGLFWIFEDKKEAKEFAELVDRLIKLCVILVWDSGAEAEYTPVKLSLQKVSAKKIMYADFDQVMESFDGFEERMEKAAKELAQLVNRRKLNGAS